MTGIADDYFEDQRRRDIILHVLFVWAAQNKTTSYRQGMHEIAGPILFVLEQELQAFKNSSSIMSPSFSESTLEAHTYFIFEKIMDEVEPLYDPTTSNVDGQPQVVHFCANLQENLLRQLDPELCDHLEQSFVQSQIYGMRWARLILGREFPLTTTHCFRIWDYVFACACSANAQVNVETKIDDKVDNDIILKSKTRYSVTTPMLIAIGNFMLAMLLHIRKELIEGDDNTTLSLLMHYPENEEITPILDLADMIRRGVLIPGAHTGVGTIDDDPMSLPSIDVSSTSSKAVPPTANTNFSNTVNKSKVPSWLGSTASSVRSAAASKIKNSASSVLHAASFALRSSSSSSTSASNEENVSIISSPSEFKHVQHGTVEDAKEMLGVVDDDGEFLSSPVDLTSSMFTKTENSQNTTTSSTSSPTSFDNSVDPLGLWAPEQSHSSASSSMLEQDAVTTNETVNNSSSSEINEMDVFSASTSTTTGARTDNSEKSLSAMSLLLDAPVNKTTFNPTKTFCNGVADRIEKLIEQSDLSLRNEGGEGNGKTSLKKHLQALGDVLRGALSLTKYDEMYQSKGSAK